MEKISIRTGSVNIFRNVHGTKNQSKETKHTNPFGISFKGNVLQADVFTSSKSKDENSVGVLGKIAEKGKSVKSAIVGGINNFNTKLNTRFNNGINKIVSFGKRVGENTKAFWKKANETNIVWDFSGLSESIKNIANMDIKDIGKNRNSYRVSDLIKHPVSDIEAMLKCELEGIEG